MTALEYRVLELSYAHKLSHIGSCLGALPILDEIYSKRRPDDPVILSCGHAGLALYCVLEKHCGKNAEDLLSRHGVHPSKNKDDGIWCSTGSLGQGITVAVGRALADRNRDVWCVISDGECAEGAVYEALCVMRRFNLRNLRLYLHSNGYAAYREITAQQSSEIVTQIVPWSICKTTTPEELGIPFLKGQDAHYYTMNEADWRWVEENQPAKERRYTGIMIGDREVREGDGIWGKQQLYDGTERNMAGIVFWNDLADEWRVCEDSFSNHYVARDNPKDLGVPFSKLKKAILFPKMIPAP